jgi:ABC-type glycerol-3-phosphate transport system permease component
MTAPVSSIPLQMAMAVLATGPAALAFLFFQKYLVRGIAIGAIK